MIDCMGGESKAMSGELVLLVCMTTAFASSG